jgi:diguanylate cyclase (GGDEF)-like protein
MADRLYHQAHHDALTDLPNRLLFADRLEEAIARAKAEDASGDCSTFAVLFLDLDRFKVVNDSLGHTAGDRLLQEVAKRLQQELRPCDTVARIGGDEFAVLLCDLPDPTHAERVAERICKALRVPVRIDGQDLFAGASIGIVAGRPDHDNADAVLREADLAMYEAKAAGRDGYATFSVDVSDTVSRRLRLEMDLRHAAERGELRAAYQPVVRLSDGALTGFEALVRWQHPEFGVLYPNAFIELAEESGQVALIDRWILEEASRQTTQWREMFDDRPLLVLNVNCSSRDLIEEGYAEHVRRILDAQRFAPDRLLLEITESLLVEDTERAAAELQRLRDRGVRFCIDDFGTGYSSLSTLHALPIDTIKVDRSFVNEMDVRSQSRKLVETVVRLGRLLDKSVVAEGIETPAQLAVLRQMGCEFGQGYLFARPLTPEAATALIADTPPWHEHWADAEDVAAQA